MEPGRARAIVHEPALDASLLDRVLVLVERVDHWHDRLDRLRDGVDRSLLAARRIEAFDRARPRSARLFEDVHRLLDVRPRKPARPPLARRAGPRLSFLAPAEAASVDVGFRARRARATRCAALSVATLGR